jgi:hypothetical protein
LSSATPQKSYRDLAPLESGGVTARNGFEFQDHVAAGYCIDMLSDENLIEVWCETLDDITLIHAIEVDEVFEFIQVKNNRFNYLWSVAELCKQESIKVNKKAIKKANSSVFEKLFANERKEAKERCLFRMVTAYEVNGDLKILKFPLNSPLRTSISDDLCKLCNEIDQKIPNYTTPYGSDITSCLSRTVWDVRHDEKSVQDDNVHKLRKFAPVFSIFLAEDQWDELYAKILRKVQNAGKSKWEIAPEAKRIERQVFITWIKEEASLAQHPSTGGTGNKLKEKMLKAGIPEDVIQNAKERRRFYRNRILDPSYMDLSKREDIEMEVASNLQELVCDLDSGRLTDNGIEFHSLCLHRLNEIKISFEAQDIKLTFLHGCMYHLTERCLHRFVRAGG